MSRQAFGEAVRILARRAGLGMLLGIAGAFAVTLLSWVVSSMATPAAADPAPPLINVVDTHDTVGLVNDTLQDAAQGNLDAVTTRVLPPESKAATSARPIVVESLDHMLSHVEKTVGSQVPEPEHRPMRSIGAVGQAAAPDFVPSPPPERHVINPPVHRPPVPVHVPAHSGLHAAEQHNVVPGQDRPAGPAAPAPGPQWDLPSAPAPSGSAGSGFHSPDTPAFESSASPFWTGRTVYRPLRSTAPVVFRTVNAQPGVTPD